MPLIVGIKILLVAFIAEFFDSSLGMGYGTILTPFLLLMGFKPLEVVPSVLLSELITGLLAGFTHHRAGNVNFKLKSTNIFFIVNKIKELGFCHSLSEGVSLHLRIAILIGICSVAGTLFAVFVAIRLSKFWLVILIGTIIFLMGVVILATINKKFKFSWKRLTLLGLIASFNKGLSGGGYGPIVTGGQLLSGVETKSTVGITSLAEGMTCFVGILGYLIMVKNVNLDIAPYNITGALLAVPLAGLGVKVIKENKLRLIIGVFTLILGLLTLTNTLSP